MNSRDQEPTFVEFRKNADPLISDGLIEEAAAMALLWYNRGQCDGRRAVAAKQELWIGRLPLGERLLVFIFRIPEGMPTPWHLRWLRWLR